MTSCDVPLTAHSRDDLTTHQLLSLSLVDIILQKSFHEYKKNEKSNKVFKRRLNFSTGV